LLKSIAKPALANFPLAKVGLGIANTPQLQAFQASGFKTSTDYKFCAAATNIHNKAASAVISQRMGYAQVNKTCFFTSVDHVHWHPKNLLSRDGKFPTIACAPQSVSADYPDSRGLDTLQQLRKLF
jgi:hypothetical protein